MHPYKIFTQSNADHPYYYYPTEDHEVLYDENPAYDEDDMNHDLENKDEYLSAKENDATLAARLTALHRRYKRYP